MPPTKENEKTGGMSYGFASKLPDAFPNASFIGFTGTPIGMPRNCDGRGASPRQQQKRAEASRRGKSDPIDIPGRVGKGSGECSKVMTDSNGTRHFSPLYALLLTSLLLVGGCTGFDVDWRGDVAKPEDRWAISLGGPTEGISFKDLYVLSSPPSASLPAGYCFIRFWPDGRCATRPILMTKFPTPKDGDKLESLLLGRYKVAGGKIRIEWLIGQEGWFGTEEGTVFADRMEFEGARKGYVYVYKKTNFPAGAMHRLKPDW